METTPDLIMPRRQNATLIPNQSNEDIKELAKKIINIDLDQHNLTDLLEIFFSKFPNYKEKLVKEIIKEDDIYDEDMAERLINYFLYYKYQKSKEDKKVVNLQPLNTDIISNLDEEKLPKQVLSVITGPLTQTIMSDPVITSQGNTYERSAIEKWISSKSEPTDPINRQKISKTLIPNIAIRSLIQGYFSKAGGKKYQTKRKKSKRSKKSKKAKK